MPWQHSTSNSRVTQSFKYCSPILQHTLLSAYINLLYIDMQWAFNVFERQTDLKRQREGTAKGDRSRFFVPERERESTRLQVTTTEESRDGRVRKEEQREMEVRGFGSFCGGLDDSAVEAWIIRAMLWVPAIIRLVHILNIQWDILGRREGEQAKGQLR